MAGSRRNTILAGAVVTAMAGMVGMSFAAIPLYRLFCAATGYESPVIYTTSPRVGGSSWKASYSPSVDDDNGPVGVACQ